MAIKQVIKRNKTVVPFDKQKIVNAINKAFLEVKGYSNSAIASSIANEIEQSASNMVSVETIQDLVETNLMEYSQYDVARSYIRYRYEHELERNKVEKEKYNQLIEEKLMAENVQNQNANVDEHSFGGRMGEMASEVSRQYALNHCVSEMARNNHLNNECYIHDLDHYALGDHNCLSIPFDDLLAKGFNTRQTDVRPANSVNTAFQLIAVIFQLQSLQQFG